MKSDVLSRGGDSGRACVLALSFHRYTPEMGSEAEGGDCREL
jgi:hypothetical protein